MIHKGISCIFYSYQKEKETSDSRWLFNGMGKGKIICNSQEQSLDESRLETQCKLLAARS